MNARDGSVAWVRVTGASRHYFRFLYGVPYNQSGNYTLSDGVAGVTFAACRAGGSLNGYYPGYTQYWGGFVITKVPACVSLGAWTPQARKPVSVRFAVGSIGCAQAG